MLCCRLVHVSCGVEVALTVVEGPVGDAFFGVCAVPRFFWCACPLRAGVFLWRRAVGLLFSWVRGAWRGCSFPVFVRASA